MENNMENRMKTMEDGIENKMKKFEKLMKNAATTSSSNVMSPYRTIQPPTYDGQTPWRSILELARISSAYSRRFRYSRTIRTRWYTQMYECIRTDTVDVKEGAMLRNKPICRLGTTPMGRRELSGLYANNNSSSMTAIERRTAKETPGSGSRERQSRKISIAAHLERVWV